MVLLSPLGSFSLLLNLNIIDVSIFGFGVTTGHRNLGGIAVFGTIVSAVSYGIIENSEEEKMLNRSDYFILLGVAISYVLTMYLWFALGETGKLFSLQFGFHVSYLLNLF